MTLFDNIDRKSTRSGSYSPLADRIRPTSLDDFVGQEHLFGKDKILRKIIESDNLTSMIFWGPPGSGKTTVAGIIKEKTSNKFLSFSAVTSGIKQLKEIMDIAAREIEMTGLKTVLFIDEIHRFNKAQQDAFLPFVEKGIITLLGATTENPSFEINSALLSRCKVFIFNRLTNENLKFLLKKAINDPVRGYGKLDVRIDDSTVDFIAHFADGDARVAYNILELSIQSATGTDKKEINITTPVIEHIIQRKMLFYDKNGEEHYNLISALHKSMRGSDPDAAAYWTVRMIESGEDPLYIIRRIVRFAAEDIGLADTNALTVSLAAKEAFRFLGAPEGNLAIVEAAVYCSLAPKSNSIYATYNNIMKNINKYLSLPVPLHIRNAPTKLMKEAGYGKGYAYPHDFKDGIVRQSYLPDEIAASQFYFPTERGFEKILKERLRKIKDYKKNFK